MSGIIVVLLDYSLVAKAHSERAFLALREVDKKREEKHLEQARIQVDPWWPDPVQGLKGPIR